MALFKKNLIPLILSGRKTQTRRNHKREWEIGKAYNIKNNYYDKGQGRIIITRKFKQRLGEISLEDAVKEGFNSIEEFKQTWININGNWNPEIIVIVYEFHKIEQQLPSTF